MNPTTWLISAIALGTAASVAGLVRATYKLGCEHLSSAETFSAKPGTSWASIGRFAPVFSYRPVTAWGALFVTVGLTAFMAHDGSVTEILAAVAQVSLVALMRPDTDSKLVQWFEATGLRVAMRRRQAHEHDGEKSSTTHGSDEAEI